jgi:glutamate/tyrosine decarboxylase-like PLP-dependent enzyme
MTWKKLPFKTIKKKVFEALNSNINYNKNLILGVPATYLDQEQFYFNAPFLKDAPFLSTLIYNPNHIGCHTYSQGESFFSGTQKIEIDVLKLIAEDIFKAEKGGYDGYVAPGGTEANIQAMWVYRNYFIKEKNASHSEIGFVFSKDSHYSTYKASNLLNVKAIPIKVNDKTRTWSLEDLNQQLNEAKKQGIKYLIIQLNMATTMFGSVDVPTPILTEIKKQYKDYFVHVDAAFGGFIYPFTNPKYKLNFKNPEISSITIDGHKMLQAPYGTGIFLCRKGLINYAQTEEASYVQGTDFTLCGSRSGANAVSIWMILMTHGYEGWKYNMEKLIDRTDRICDVLDDLKVNYFRNPYMNIVTIDARDIPKELAHKYHLVADNFNNPKWWKIVVMAHVEKHIIDQFLLDLQKSK